MYTQCVGSRGTGTVACISNWFRVQHLKIQSTRYVRELASVWSVVDTVNQLMFRTCGEKKHKLCQEQNKCVVDADSVESNIRIYIFLEKKKQIETFFNW